MAVMSADIAFTHEDLDALPEGSPYPVELSARALRPA